MRPVVLSLMLTLTLGMAACAGAPTPMETVAEPTPSATPTPTPEPTRPAATDLIVTPDGIGTLRVGGPVPDTDDPRTALVVLTPAICLAPHADGTQPPTESGWVADPSLQSPTATYLTAAGQAPFSIAFEDSAVTRIDITGSGPKTSGGIEVGSTREEVLAAHEAELVFSSVVSEVYRIGGTTGQLLIEVVVLDDWSGPNGDAAGRVLVMRIVPSDEEPRPVAGSDNVVHGCSYTGP